MTKKLFYTNSKVYEWDTVITEAYQEDGKWHITLEETAFYPEGGGQPADLGLINDVQVIDVYKKEEQVIHILEEKPENPLVHCTVDKWRRIDHTQHHSGQHLLSAVALNLYDAETLSFHLSNDSATIDLNVPFLSEEQLLCIEKTVNLHILENHKVNVFYIDKNEADLYLLKKIPTGIDKLRIVQIEDIEYNACAGTHVGSTSEIGCLKLLKSEKMKGHIRLHFICGIRLLKDYNQKHQLISDLTKNLTTGQELILQQVERIKLENKEKERQYSILFEQFAEALTNQIISKNTSNFVIKTLDQLSNKELTIISQKLIDKGIKVVSLGSTLENKILLSQNGDSHIDCGQIIKEFAVNYSGKGGGNTKKAQAMFPSNEKMNEFLQFLRNHFSNLLTKTDEVFNKF